MPDLKFALRRVQRLFSMWLPVVVDPLVSLRLRRLRGLGIVLVALLGVMERGDWFQGVSSLEVFLVSVAVRRSFHRFYTESCVFNIGRHRGFSRAVYLLRSRDSVSG